MGGADMVIVRGVLVRVVDVETFRGIVWVVGRGNRGKVNLKVMVAVVLVMVVVNVPLVRCTVAGTWRSWLRVGQGVESEGGRREVRRACSG